MAYTLAGHTGLSLLQVCSVSATLRRMNRTDRAWQCCIDELGKERAMACYRWAQENPSVPIATGLERCLSMYRRGWMERIHKARQVPR